MAAPDLIEEERELIRLFRSAIASAPQARADADAALENTKRESHAGELRITADAQSTYDRTVRKWNSMRLIFDKASGSTIEMEPRAVPQPQSKDRPALAELKDCAMRIDSAIAEIEKMISEANAKNNDMKSLIMMGTSFVLIIGFILFMLSR